MIKNEDNRKNISEYFLEDEFNFFEGVESEIDTCYLKEVDLWIEKMDDILKNKKFHKKK